MPYTASQLAAYYTSVNFGQAPDAATQAQFTQYAAANAAGALSDQQTLAYALQTAQVRATTDVAVAIYQYFNGAAPSQAGINFLLNTPGSGLNTSYYNGATGTATNPSPGGFNLENRYYNLAVSQAFQGPGATAFASTYGALSLSQTVATAYEQIVGAAVVGIAQATAAVASIQTSIPFFQSVAASRAGGFNQDLATKAIIVGYILEESIRADVGAYALAIDQLNAAIANGTAVYNTNILTAYGVNAPNYGSGVGGGTAPTYLAGSTVAQQRLNLGAGAVVIVNGSLSAGTTLQLKDASGPNDSLTLVFDNQNTTSAPGIAGTNLPQLVLGGTVAPGQVETLNIVSAGNLTSAVFGSESGMTFNAATAPNNMPNKVAITGTQPFFLATNAATHNMTIDGSGATGGLTIRADATTAAGVAITLIGGSVNDTLEAGLSTTTVAQTITGGGGGDLILLGGGSYSFQTDTITGGSATHKPIDTLVYKAVSDSLFSENGEPGASRTSSQFANTSTTDTVIGFVTGQDKIDVKALGFAQAQLVIADKGQVADINAFNALVAAGTVFKDSGGVVRAVSEIHNGTDTFVAFDANHNGLFDAGADLVIHFYNIPLIGAGDLLGN